jgi:hypothetical protein
MVFRPIHLCVVVAAALAVAEAAHIGALKNYPANGQIPLGGVCTQSSSQLYLSGSFDKIFVALNYSAFSMLHDLGSYDLCTVVPDSHYCTTYLGVMCVLEDGSSEVLASANGCNSGPVIGMCVAQECDGTTLSNQVQNYTRSADFFQALYDFTSLCVEVPAYCTSQSYGFMTADCLDEQKSFTSDSSAVAVFAVIVVLCTLSIACAVAGIYRRWSLATDAELGESGRLLPKQLGSNFAEVNVAPSDGVVVAAPSKIWEAVSWFDLIENIRDFFTVKARNVGSVDTRFFEGVRTIAMLFVLFGTACTSHRC